MRLTKDNKYLKRENANLIKKKNISRDLDKFDFSNLINNKGEIYLQKNIRTSKEYRSINIKRKEDSNYLKNNNLNNFGKNKQYIFSTDEKRQKAINNAMNSFTDKSKEKINQLNSARYNFNSFNYKYFPTEQEDIIDSKGGNIYMEVNNNEPNYEEIQIKKCKKCDIINNKLQKLNLNFQKSSFNIPISQIENLNKSEPNNFIDKFNNNNINIQNSFNIEEKINKKFDKNKNNIRNQEFFKKLKLINDNHSFNMQKVPSPVNSTSKRRFSPFKDILSKSSNNFFINKIPINNNENDYQGNLSINHFNNNASKSKRITTSKEETYSKSIKNNYKTINEANSNKCFMKINNSNVIYRNKKAINQKIYQSNSLNNNNTYRRNNQKNFICINPHIANDKNENEIENMEKSNHNNFDININEEEDEEKGKNFNINKEEIKKYLEYFIKDITPININQFVIYSHSNNNYKNEENIKNESNNEIFTINKSYSSFNNSKEFKYNKKIPHNMINSTYMQEFDPHKLKDNLFDFSNKSINKIHVKKRPVNENNSPHNNDNNNDNNDNYTGFCICKQRKGETILKIPINIKNIFMINQFLKESGFEISKIKSNNKLNEKENIKQKRKVDISYLTEEINKKKKNNTISNLDLERKLSNKKEKIKTKNSGLNIIKDINKKTTNQKIIKKERNEEKFSKNINNIKKMKDENEAQKKIFVKLNENFEDIENNYINKNKNKHKNKADLDFSLKDE